jgi:hypothetical protein
LTDYASLVRYHSHQ